MNLPDFEHTRKEAVDMVYSLYLEGYSEEEIFILSRVDLKMISNIIDCVNYLNI